MLFISTGILCNALVMGENEGKMPVGMQKADMLFVIGPAQFGVTHFPVPSDFDERHQALTEHTKLRVLADRIPVSLEFVNEEKLPHWIKRLLDSAPPPIGQEIIVSFGDLLLLIGTLLPMVNLTLYLLWMLWVRKKVLHGYSKT